MAVQKLNVKQMYSYFRFSKHPTWPPTTQIYWGEIEKDKERRKTYFSK